MESIRKSRIYPVFKNKKRYAVVPMRGRFIVLEGPDGSGTTTHVSLLADALRAQGEDAIVTQEPTTGPIGTFIRQELSKGVIPAAALQMLFSADRAWHVEDVLLPALEEGKTIVCDRYLLSTLIYGQALGLDSEWLEHMNKNFIRPDKLIIVLPPFETCFKRINKRETKDMLESQDSLQRAVYDGYIAYAEKHSIPVVDSSAEKTVVAAQLLNLAK